jgi:hypothetical protein
MRMPGFCAEISLYRSENNYRMAGTFGQPEGVTLALPPLSFGGSYGSGGAPDAPTQCQLKCQQLHCKHPPSTECSEFCFKQCFSPIIIPWGTNSPDPVTCGICKAACFAWNKFCEASPLSFLCNLAPTCDCPTCG